jgi:RNA polymerase sigma-70 factor (ECF subfamily)
MADTGKDYIVWESFRTGDEKAFSSIFNSYVQELYKYGIKFSSDEELVKDSIQELFIKIYSNRNSLGTTDNIRFYLFKALKRRLIDELSRLQNTVSLSTMSLPFEVEGSPEDQDEEWEQIVRKKKLKNALSHLSPRQREAIYLRYDAEMSLEQIAELLDMNYQSTRNLIHRGIEKLRKLILLPSLFIFFLIF